MEKPYIDYYENAGITEIIFPGRCFTIKRYNRIIHHGYENYWTDIYNDVDDEYVGKLVISSAIRIPLRIMQYIGQEMCNEKQ